MTLHAVDAISHGASQINIYSPDTDVFIFFFKEDVNSSAMMCILLLVMVIANEVSIWNLLCMALSSTRVEALPGLHTLSGADFHVISTVKKKATWWKALKEENEETITSLANLGKRAQPTADILSGIEKLVCQVYVPNTTANNVKELRWWLFKKKAGSV